MYELSKSHQDTHSQSGEDGLLTEIFTHLGIERGIFCEFGAWDGSHLSNCRAFYDRGWGGWYIEGSPERFKDLQRNISDPRAENICSFVQPTGPDSLDALLKRSKLYANGVRTIDLLSIDIDSDDLAVWRGVKEFRAKVVIIEFNPTIPVDVFFENTPGVNSGNAPRSIYEFARTNEYDLVAAIGTNLVFVDRRLDSDIQVIELAPVGFRYFFGYDGTLFVTKSGPDGKATAPEIIKVPWAAGVFPQPVDKPFRKFDPGKTARVTLRVWSYLKLALTNPVAILSRIFRGQKKS